jgi:predicted RNA-binding protein
MKRLPLVLFFLLAVGAMADDARKITVYYLHNTWRCYSCNSIESLTRAAVFGGKGENTKFRGEIDVTCPFPEMVKAGTLVFQSVNIDLDENKHLLEDFKAKAKYPVLVETKGDKVVRSKMLGKVWDLLGNNAEFVKYVQTELRAFAGDDAK